MVPGFPMTVDEVVDFSQYAPGRHRYRSSRSLSGAGSLEASSTTGASGTVSTTAWCRGTLDRGLGAPARDRLLRLPSVDGYRQAFMMLDEDVVALSRIETPCIVEGGPPGPLELEASKKGTGFVPLRPHQHWHGYRT